MAEANDLFMLRPTLPQAMSLLGKWLVCRVSYGDGGVFDTDPAQVVGVVVPAPGLSVEPQLLMHSWKRVEPGGYECEIYLESIQYLRVVSPPLQASVLPVDGLGGRIHDRFAVVGGVDFDQG